MPRRPIAAGAAALALAFLIAGCQTTPAPRADDDQPMPDATEHAVAPFLMFTGKAEEAMAFYTATIDDSSILSVERFGEGEAGEAGKVKFAAFSLGGQKVLCTDSPPVHDFTFTPSMSLFVTCADEGQIRRYYDAFMDGGSAMMPLNDYGFSTRFAWVQDRFGVSWQLNLP